MPTTAAAQPNTNLSFYLHFVEAQVLLRHLLGNLFVDYFGVFYTQYVFYEPSGVLNSAPFELYEPNGLQDVFFYLRLFVLPLW